MSMVSFALRATLVRALRGCTLAGPAVFDSPVDPSATAANAATPTIFVYSDAERLEHLEGRSFLEGLRTVEMSILIVLPANFSVMVNGQPILFQDRKAGTALAIDLIYRQIERALLEESSVWSELWVRFSGGAKEIEAHAYVLQVDKGGLNLPARAIRLIVEPINSPHLGAPPEGVWAELITAMAADPGLSPLAPLIAATIEGDALPEWRVDAIALGETVLDAQLLGEAPIGGGPNDELAPMRQATINITTSGVPDSSTTIQDRIPSGFEP